MASLVQVEQVEEVFLVEARQHVVQVEEAGLVQVVQGEVVVHHHPHLPLDEAPLGADLEEVVKVVLCQID
jgi:hypothetical protein